MIFKNLTNVTTQPINSGYMQDLFVGVSGSGTATMEFLGDDAVWRSYPQSVFTAPTAQKVYIRNCQYRFVVAGGPLTIEIGGNIT